MRAKRIGAAEDVFSPHRLSCVPSFVVAVVLGFTTLAFSQQALPRTAEPKPVSLTSREFVGDDGLTIDKLIELGSSRRADILAARQRLAIAEGKLRQATLRPNPTLSTEYGSPRFLSGEAESELSVGITQVFELGGKRSKRRAVAQLELSRVKAEMSALERILAIEIRSAYTNTLATARQLDVLEKLILTNEEFLSGTEARLREGDVAPLDLNLVRVENDRFKVQAILTRSAFETGLLELRTLIGSDINDVLIIANQPERPRRFDTDLKELTDMALRARADLQAARIGEELGVARIDLAKANAVSNLAAGIKYSRNNSITDFPPRLGGGTFPNRDESLTFGVTVDIPLFNRNQGEIASARGEKVQAVLEREFLEASIRRDVAVAYRKYKAVSEALVIFSTQILPRAEDNLRTVRAAYGLGDFSVFEVVNEQRRLTENVTNYNQVVRDYYNALTEIETAIGTTLPASGFSDEQSVLPDKSLVQTQTQTQMERTKLLKTIRSIETTKSAISNFSSEKDN